MSANFPFFILRSEFLHSFFFYSVILSTAVLTYLVAKKMKKTFEVRRNDFVGQRVAVKAPPLDISGK